jgi:hypothetical protein
MGSNTEFRAEIILDLKMEAVRFSETFGVLPTSPRGVTTQKINVDKNGIYFFCDSKLKPRVYCYFYVVLC